MLQWKVMDKTQTIAGVVLTLNEENDLGRALRSLIWCDELLVVDSGSTDRTQEVAEHFGAQFVEHIQTPPFLITEQRNWVLDNSGLKSDWVFFLDADEEASPKLVECIISSINSPSSFDCYELTPRYWFLGQWLKRTQGYPNWHPRLVRRGFVRFDGGVWESFAASSRIGRLPYPYEHYAFSKGFDDWLERHRRYATWDAEQIAEYLTSCSSNSLQTQRRRTLRLLMSRFWIFRPPLRFFQKYILQLGFLEGWQAFLFALMMSFYDFIAVVKVIELLRRKRGLPL